MPKTCKLTRHRALARTVAACLKRTYPYDENRQVSHETINKTLFIQACRALKKELLAHL
jgi:hypothetical protein